MSRADDRAFPWEEPEESFSFATPEQIEVTYRVAPFGSRIAAAFLDNLLVLMFSAIVFLGIVVLGRAMPSPRFAFYALLVALVAGFCLQMFYFVWSELRHEGRTWGKKRLKLRTVMLSGHGLTFGASFVRNLARVVDNVPLLWLVPVLTRGRRRVGDLLAGTLVVSESALDTSRPSLRLARSYRELEDRRFFFSGEAQAGLFPDDLNLLEHLFARAPQLPDRAQQEDLFRSVAARYAERLALEAERPRVEAEPRRFLEELYLLLVDRYESERF
jgi:uncharacterized RDD family membrane protein YckC